MSRKGTLLGIALGTGALALGCHSLEPTRPPVSRPQAPPEPLQLAGYRGANLEAVPAEPQATTTPAQVIDLGAALRLGGASNPTIQLAQEQVREAVGELDAARVLLLPHLNVGGNLRVHRGVLQGGRGQITDVNSQSLYLGAGAEARGSGTVGAPGIFLFANLGDAVYEPLAARQRVAAQQSTAQATQNAILRDVAVAYLELVGADARRTILREGAVELAEVARVTRAFADKGQGSASDANRAEANAQLLNRELQRAEEELAVASARLCRLLNLDPSTALNPPGGVVEPLRMIPEELGVEPLVLQAQQNRPEVFARSADVGTAQTRERQARMRPWLPTVSLGYSAGAFGGGSNLAADKFGSLSGRTDFDAAAVWTFGNLGFGNAANVRRTQAGVGQAVAGLDVTVNQIRREVAEAHAESQAAARQLDFTKAAAEVSIEGYTLEKARIQQGQGRPIEALDSFRQWVDSRQDYLRAVIAFNVAQFRLYTAVGSPPQR